MKFVLNLLLIIVGMAVGFGLISAYKNSQILLPVQPLVSSSPVETPLPVASSSSFFSLDKQPSQSLLGKITTMSGDVFWQGRVATEPAVLNSLIPIQQGESLLTGKNGKLEASFENAAHLTISSNSQVDIIQTLPNNIVIEQSKGIVDYKKLGTIPLSIRVMHLLIESGAEIQIIINSQKPIVSVKVIDGVATVAYNNTSNVSKVLQIQKGKILTFNDQTRRVVLK